MHDGGDKFGGVVSCADRHGQCEGPSESLDTDETRD